MARTSLFGKAIEYEPGEHAANEAVDTLQARVIANNVAHLADASSQVLVASPPKASGSGFSFTFPASGTLFGLLATFGPLFPRLRGNGRPNAVRFRLRGRTGTVSNDVEFAVWLHSYSEDPAGIGVAVNAFEATAGNDAVQILTATSTTPSWLTPDSGDRLLRMTAREAAGSGYSIGVRDEIGGSDVGTLPPCSAISVFVRRASGSTATSAELNGLYAAEVFA